MAQIGIEIDGLEEVLRGLDKLQDLPDLLRPAVNEALDLLLGRVREYPPPRGDYQRTGNLRQSWNKQLLGGGGVLGRVWSDSGTAPYNRYVQSRESQAWMHRGRWQTAEDVAEKEKDAVVSILIDALNRYLQTI